MSAIKDKDDYIKQWALKVNDILLMRNTLTREELEDCVQRVSRLRDEKLQQYVATLIGWGDAERAELVVFTTMALSAMRELRPSKLREIAERIETKYLLHKQENKNAD